MHYFFMSTSVRSHEKNFPKHITITKQHAELLCVSRKFSWHLNEIPFLIAECKENFSFSLQIFLATIEKRPYRIISLLIWKILWIIENHCHWMKIWIYIYLDWKITEMLITFMLESCYFSAFWWNKYANQSGIFRVLAKYNNLFWNTIKQNK